MDASNQPLLDVRDLSVAFGNSLAVDRVSFSIGRGQCTALVGESGSGKSVSALSILKLLPYPAASHPSGTIHFNGRELLSADDREMREVRVVGVAVGCGVGEHRREHDAVAQSEAADRERREEQGIHRAIAFESVIFRNCCAVDAGMPAGARSAPANRRWP